LTMHPMHQGAVANPYLSSISGTRVFMIRRARVECRVDQYGLIEKNFTEASS